MSPVRMSASHRCSLRAWQGFGSGTFPKTIPIDVMETGHLY